MDGEVGAEDAGTDANHAEGDGRGDESHERFVAEHGEHFPAAPSPGRGGSGLRRTPSPRPSPVFGGGSGPLFALRPGFGDEEVRNEDDGELRGGDEDEHPAQLEVGGDESADDGAGEHADSLGGVADRHAAAPVPDGGDVGHEYVGADGPEGDEESGGDFEQGVLEVARAEELEDEDEAVPHGAGVDHGPPSPAVGEVAGEWAGDHAGRSAERGDEPDEDDGDAEGSGEEGAGDPQRAGAEAPGEEDDDDGNGQAGGLDRARLSHAALRPG